MNGRKPACFLARVCVRDGSQAIDLPMSAATVLVVEDDSSIRRGLVDALRFAGYQVVECGDGLGASKLAIESNIDLMLLDVILPGQDGFSILQIVRDAKPTLPVIMVTARGSEHDRVHGLKHGADDYIIKPFSALEVLARVEAVLRRSPARPLRFHTLRHNGRCIHIARREVAFSDGVVHQLTEREIAILAYLASHRDRTIDRRELLQNVWGLDPKGMETRTVDMHIARLREKIGDDSAAVKDSVVQSESSFILTVRGKGYKLATSVQIQ